MRMWPLGLKEFYFDLCPNQFRDNLTSILAFYAYFIIGMDYDSFPPSGGTAYFKEAQNVVTQAQSAPGKGWKSNESEREIDIGWLIISYGNYSNQ